MTPVSDIQIEVAAYFKITLEQLLSKKRVRAFSYPRMIAMYLSYQRTKNSYPEIARAFGCNHTTVMHAVRWAGTNQSMRGHIVELWKILSAKIVDIS